MELRILAYIVLLLALTTLGFDVFRSPIQRPQEALIPSGAQGTLALPETEFKPILDQANNEMNRRFTAGKQYLGWKRIVGWIALVISASISFIGAFYGKTAPLNAGSDITETLKGVNNPQQIVRVVCLLLATSSILSLLSQNLEAESVKLISEGKILSDAIIETTQTLYDPTTAQVKARVAMHKLTIVMRE